MYSLEFPLLTSGLFNPFNTIIPTFIFYDYK